MGCTPDENGETGLSKDTNPPSTGNGAYIDTLSNAQYPLLWPCQIKRIFALVIPPAATEMFTISEVVPGVEVVNRLISVQVCPLYPSIIATAPLCISNV